MTLPKLIQNSKTLINAKIQNLETRVNTLETQLTNTQTTVALTLNSPTIQVTGNSGGSSTYKLPDGAPYGITYIFISRYSTPSIYSYDSGMEVVGGSSYAPNVAYIMPAGAYLVSKVQSDAIYKWHIVKL